MVIKLVLAMFVAACAACSYSSSFRDCEVACSASTGCPPGFTCAASEGLCRSGATAASCAAALDGGVDADTGVDAVVDAAIDASTDPCAGVTAPVNCTMFVCDGTCHLYCTTPRTWDLAKAACEGMTGWWLTEINSLAEDMCVDGNIPDSNTWLGLHQASGSTSVGASWSWSHSGAAIPPTGTAFKRWESDEGTGSAPNDQDNTEDGTQQCASTSGDNSGWDDRECSQTIPYVCERFP